MTGPTAAGAAPAYVRVGEEVLWLGKPTLLVLLSNALGFSVFLIFMGVFFVQSLASGGPALASLFPVAALVIFAVVLFLNALRLRRTEYVITDHGVYTRSGIIGQSVIQTTYDKITDIALRQDVLGRVFGYSTLQVNTAGSNTAPVQMSGLPRALEVKQHIEQVRETFLQRGRTPAPTTWQPAPQLPRFTLEKDVMRVLCTTTRKPFKRPRTDEGKRVACPHCERQHLAKEAGRGKPTG